MSASPQDSRTPASQVNVNAGLLGCPGQEVALSIASDRLAHQELLLDKESTESEAPSLLNLEPKPRKRLKRFLMEAKMQPPLENLYSAELEPLLPRRARGSGRGRRPWGSGSMGSGERAETASTHSTKRALLQTQGAYHKPATQELMRGAGD